jgi:DNA-binding ferritin-like protein
MQDNGEISEESAEELTNSINKIAEKILDINYTPSSWLIKK